MASIKELDVSDGTIIGPSILISGKLSGEEDLTIRGRVEGDLSLTNTLIVEPAGIVKANVSVRNAIVAGVVVGNIVASESVELTKEGRMVGDIRSPRVIIVDGASFRGQVDMVQAESSQPTSERLTARPVLRPSVRSTANIARPTAHFARPDAAPHNKVLNKPLPPPAPVVSKPAENVSKPTERKSQQLPPPIPVLLGKTGKKKVILKKKK